MQDARIQDAKSLREAFHPASWILYPESGSETGFDRIRKQSSVSSIVKDREPQHNHNILDIKRILWYNHTFELNAREGTWTGRACTHPS
jgi:hypothetical protein